MKQIRVHLPFLTFKTGQSDVDLPHFTDALWQIDNDRHFPRSKKVLIDADERFPCCSIAHSVAVIHISARRE